jgi:PAS domain S-box-containing protein
MVFEGDLPVDFIFLEVNDAFTRQTGMRDVVGKRVTEIVPNLRQTDPKLLEVYGRVARTGCVEHFERRVEALGMWFAITAYSTEPDHFDVIFDVVDDRVAAAATHRLQTTALEAAANAIVITDASGRVEWVNPAFERLTGHARASVIGQNPRVLKSGKHDAAFYADLWGTITSGRVWHGELVNRRADGTEYHEAMTITPVRDGAGTITHFIAIKEDITERVREREHAKQMEEQLRGAQKLEAIGRLAGGVAHDFNNLLSVVLVYCELAHRRLHEGDLLREDIDEIARAGKQGQRLTQQLLAFSRRQLLEVEPVDLNTLVTNLARMLERLLGEDIALDVQLESNLNTTSADKGQIEQVLMNLAINARDAMPTGGHLRIATANVEVDAARAAALDVAPGSYTVLTVTDDGVGMDEATRARIFEPFFTTKEVGRGTGLGLSVVYGIARQTGGAVEVDSAPGVGTTFRVLLPQREGAAVPRATRRPTLPTRSARNETILVVEDEPALRGAVRRGLLAVGYHVLAAASAEEALRLCDAADHRVDLVITDVVMPGGNGVELARSVEERCPTARVLFVSGYTDDTIHSLDVIGPRLLRKPFDMQTLLERVRGALDEPS